MRRIVGLVAIAAVVALGFRLLKDETEYHGGSGKPGTQTAVTFHVTTKNYYHPDAVAAQVLWQVCVGSIGWASRSQPVALHAGVYRAVVRPSLTADTKRRLRGCLNEATVDHVEGHVQSTIDGL